MRWRPTTPAASWPQAIGVLVAIAWSALATWLILAVLRAAMGLRVADGDERAGLDLTTHGERAYS